MCACTRVCVCVCACAYVCLCVTDPLTATLDLRRYFLQTLVPGNGTLKMPPHGEMTRLLKEAEYTSVPRRFEGSLLDAANAAKRQLKVVIAAVGSGRVTNTFVLSIMPPIL